MLEEDGKEYRNFEQLRRFDDCLDVLEDEQERGATHVTQKIYNLVHNRVPTIIVGMTLLDAIEEVFHYQEPYMTQGEHIKHERRRDYLKPKNFPDITKIINGAIRLEDIEVFLNEHNDANNLKNDGQ